MPPLAPVCQKKEDVLNKKHQSMRCFNPSYIRLPASKCTSARGIDRIVKLSLLANVIDRMPVYRVWIDTLDFVGIKTENPL